MPGERSKLRGLRSAWHVLGACCVCAALRLQAIDAAALPLPYPANYPSENYTPPSYDIRSNPGLIAPELLAQMEQPPASKGIQFGKLMLRPFAGTDATYSDNVLRDRLNHQEDVLLDCTTGLSSTMKPLECVSAKLNYEFGWHDYARDIARDYLTHLGFAELRLDRVGVEGLSLILTDSYQQTANSGALENQITQFTRYQTNSAQLRAQYNYNRFSISGSYSNTFIDYFARTNDSADYVAHTGIFDAAWKVPGRRIEVFQNFQFTRNLFDVTPQQDYDALTFLSGVRGKYSKLTFTVAAGYARSNPHVGNRTQSGPAFNALIGYAPHRRISLEVAANRAFQAGVLTGSETVTDVKAQATVTLTRRGTWTNSYSRSFSERRNNTEQLSVAYTTRFEYKLGRNAVLNAGYSRFQRESTPQGGDFLINEARVGCKLLW